MSSIYLFLLRGLPDILKLDEITINNNKKNVFKENI